jgi:hypothetical protein
MMSLNKELLKKVFKLKYSTSKLLIFIFVVGILLLLTASVSFSQLFNCRYAGVCNTYRTGFAQKFAFCRSPHAVRAPKRPFLRPYARAGFCIFPHF